MWRSSQGRRTRTFHGHERQRRHRAGCGGACRASPRIRASPASTSSRTGATPWPRGWPWRMRRSAASMCSISSGTRTWRARFFSTVCSARPTAACACVCCSTISARCPPTITLLTIDSHPNIEVRMFNPVGHAFAAGARHGRRLRTHQQADAQQVLHCRRTGRHRRRPQYRRRIFRGS